MREIPKFTQMMKVADNAEIGIFVEKAGVAENCESAEKCKVDSLAIVAEFFIE